MIELIGQIFNSRNFNMAVPAFAVAFIIVAYKNPDEPIYIIGAIAFSIITVFIVINLIVGRYRQQKYKQECIKANEEEERRHFEECKAQAIYAYEMLNNEHQDLLKEVVRKGQIAGFSNVFVFRDINTGLSLSSQVESMLAYNSNLYAWVKCNYADDILSVTIIEPLLEVLKSKME